MIDQTVIITTSIIETLIAMGAVFKNWLEKYLAMQFDLRSSQHQILFSKIYASREEVQELREEINRLQDELLRRSR